MSTIATIWVKLGLNSADYNTGLDSAVSKAEKSSKSISTTMKDVGTSMMKTGGVMTAGLTVPLVGMGMNAMNAASDLEESMNAVNVVFGDSADIIKDFADNSASTIGVAASDYGQLSAELGSLLKNVGYSSVDAANETNILGQRAADMASIFNTDVTQALEAIQSGLKN